MNDVLQDELLTMLECDQRVRAELAASKALFDGYHPKMEAVHNQNAEKLDAIITEYGWPGMSLVGSKGGEAAWLILQHAIAKPQLQRKCLPLLKVAAGAGEIPSYQLAYLEDRINIWEGRAQRYGTQFDWDEKGQLSPLTLQDPGKVDVYRESVGLGALSEKVKQMRRQAQSEGDSPPPDFNKQQEEKQAWAKSVGWL